MKEKPNYMREYADELKMLYSCNNLMSPEIKETLIDRVDKVLTFFQNGFLTVNETMFELATIAKEGFKCW